MCLRFCIRWPMWPRKPHSSEATSGALVSESPHQQPADPSNAEAIQPATNKLTPHQRTAITPAALVSEAPLHPAEDLSKGEAIQPPTNKRPPHQRTAIPPTSGSPPQAGQQQLPPVTAGLPSRVDETLAVCPRFRILLVGKSGIGKSSLVKTIFNIDPDKIDISHNRAGEADIEREYTSPENPRFILHDSKGFEAGSRGNWTTVENSLRVHQKNDLPGRIHAIWFCVETPLTGARLLQTGDESLLKLAKEFNIPIIVVFTKYDRLVVQFYKDDLATPKPERLVNARQKASESFDLSVKELKVTDPSILCVNVSTKGSGEKELLINLANVTRKRLQDVEEKLQVPWVAAQQVNARQKVEVSISEGFKKYWLDLGQSSAFEGQILIDCIHRVHEDVLKVWNFYDPNEILSSTEFFTTMIGLVKPLFEHKANETLFPTAVPSFGSSGAKVLVPLLQRLGLNDSAINYLYDKYQQYPSTAKLLSTYIINLILVLYGVFSDILPSDPPRPLSDNVVRNILTGHQDALKNDTLNGIDSEPEFATHPERVIANVIVKRLPPDSAGSGV